MVGQMAGTVPTAIAIGSAAALPATVLGTPAAGATVFSYTTAAAFFTQSALIEGGNSYEDLRSMGVGHDQAAATALAVGLINGSLELVGAKVAAKPFQGAVRHLGRRLAGGLAAETPGRAFGSAIAEYVKTVGAEVTTEVMQEITNVVAEGVTRPDGELPETWGEIRERLSSLAIRQRWSEMPALISGTAMDFAPSSSATSKTRR